MLAESLVAKGHHVVRFGISFDHMRKQQVAEKLTKFDLHEKRQIVVVPTPGYKKNISLKRYICLQIGAKRIVAELDKHQTPDVVVVCSPPPILAERVVEYCRQNNIPSVLDIRDPWPRIFFDILPKWTHFFLKLAVYPMKRSITKASKHCTAITSNLAHMADEAVKLANESKRVEIFPLGGKRIPEKSPELVGEARHNLRRGDGKVNFIFVGSFSSLSNPTIILKASKILKAKEIIGWHVWIVGDGNNKEDVLAQHVGLEKEVTLTGWLTQSEFNVFLKHSHIGLQPTSKPVDVFGNKIFTYLSASLPIITCSEGELLNVIQKRDVGANYLMNDAKSLANAMRSYIENSRKIARQSTNAKTLFETEYDSEIIYDKYADFLEEVAREHSRPRMI